MMELKEYLNITFPGLILKPSLYHQWDIGIHFQLGDGIYQFKSGTYEINYNRFKRAYSQATSIFNALFSEQDEIFLVTNVYQHRCYTNKKKRIKVYNQYIKTKDLKFHLKQEILPNVFDEEEADGYYTSRFSLKCRKQDLKYPLLIKAACNEDFPLKPKFDRNYSSYYPDVFFINVTQNSIFFIYDDRGCEVIASNKETIRSIYEKYNDWIDEYNREEIAQRFR